MVKIDFGFFISYNKCITWNKITTIERRLIGLVTRLLNKVVEIKGETAIIPGTNDIICRATVEAYRQFANNLCCDDYHPQILKEVYNFLSDRDDVDDICMLIKDGYIYMFPESKENIEYNFNTLLIAQDLFDKNES